MEDFTKPFKLDLPTTTVVTTVLNEFGGIYDKPKQRKKSFINSRKNKDNFWNLMFGVGIWSFAMIGKLPIALVLMPLMLKYFNNTKFNNSKFFNSENNELAIPKQLPNGFLLIATVVITIVLFAKYDNLPKVLSSALFTFIVFGIPVLFFIFKNCPISILFNYQFYKQNARVSKYSGSDNRSSLYNDASSHQWKTDPMKSYRWDNIYHR